MLEMNFYKLNKLPEKLDSNSFYFINNGEFAESYLTNNNGEAFPIGNSAMITKVSQTFFDDLKTTIITYNNISERDADFKNIKKSSLVLVKDASGDEHVVKGAALYWYNFDEKIFDLLSQYENIKFELSWNEIKDKPESFMQWSKKEW